MRGISVRQLSSLLRYVGACKMHIFCFQSLGDGTESNSSDQALWWWLEDIQHTQRDIILLQLLMAAMSSAVKLLVIVVGMAALVDWRRGDAYSTGPPSTSCRSMTPSHYRAQPRTDPPPYVITFDSTQSTERRVEGNDTIVKIKHNETTGDCRRRLRLLFLTSNLQKKL